MIKHKKDRRSNKTQKKFYLFYEGLIVLLAVIITGWLVWKYTSQHSASPEVETKNQKSQTGLTYDQVKAYAAPTVASTTEIVEDTSESDVQQTIKGSCMQIEKKSQCLDYMGLYWTEEHMKDNCTGVGILTSTPCPQPSIGGCYLGNQTQIENMMWSYPYGGSPVTEQNMAQIKTACESTPGATWINGIMD